MVFGMKAHIGVDRKTKVIHAVVATAANVHDAMVLPDLLHGGYKGVVNEVERARNRIKARIRSRVEHVFGVIKGVFPFTKVRYRGLD